MAQDNPNTDNARGCKDPAPQPHGQKPGADCSKPPYDHKPPDLTPKPEPCQSSCDCPVTPKPNGTCLDDLITQEATTAALGEEAKKSKAELEGFLAKMKTASAKYTPEAYVDLLKRWRDNDALIVDLIRKLVCNVPCWFCVVECEICPLVNAIIEDERQLNGTNELYKTANSLYDQRYWWWREREIQSDAFDRVSKVMSAWQDPYTTIDGVLKSTNSDVTAASQGKLLGPELNKMIYDLFFRWIPQHLAIAPPVDIAATAIQKKYVELCGCDEPGKVDDCCGPNIGPLTVRERLVGPLPFLIKPELFPELICCLATNAYRPAKAAFAAASAAFTAIDTAIANLKKSITARLTSLPADAKIRLGRPIDCKDYMPKRNGTNNAGGDDKTGCGGGGTAGTATP